MDKSDARPLRSVLFAAGNNREILDRAAASGADSLVCDLEEPATPYPESERVKGREVARAFFDSHDGQAQLLFARVQNPFTGQTTKDLHAVMGPSLAGILIPKVQGPADIHAADALLGCMEVEYGLPFESLVIYPVLETAQALRLAYEIAMASPRVAYMGGALSRFGDIHQALGFRWTGARQGSATRSAACGVAAATTSTACASGRSSSATSGTSG
jgi:citrate lyase subunit beta/citryl-CoA lyase